MRGGKGNPLTSIVKEYGIEVSDLEGTPQNEIFDEDYFLKTDDWRGYGFDMNGKQIPQVILQEAAIKVDTIIKSAIKEGPSLVQDTSMRQSIEDKVQQLIVHLHSKYSNLIENSSNNYFRLLVENLLVYFLETMDGASLHELSANHYHEYHKFVGTDNYVYGGYGNFARAIANKLSHTAPNQFNILLNHEVNIIDVCKDSKTVSIKGMNHATNEHFEIKGHCVVVTVPLGVLKANKIQFNPPLPLPKVEAIERLGMGVLDKIFLEFKTAFWEKDNDKPIDWLLLAPKDIGKYAVFLNLQYYTGPGVPVLCCFLGSSQARQSEAESEEAVVSHLLTMLASHYGNQVKSLFVEAFRTRWSSDPFSLGSYSFTKLGTLPRHFEDIGEPAHEIMFFAGEASIRNHFSTVHGAYLSGVREGKRIAELFSIPPQ